MVVIVECEYEIKSFRIRVLTFVKVPYCLSPVQYFAMFDRFNVDPERSFFSFRVDLVYATTTSFSSSAFVIENRLDILFILLVSDYDA